MKKLTGVAPAMITPFKNDESLDLERLEKHAALLFDQGVSGLCVCGSSGEFESLSLDECVQVYQKSVEVAKVNGGYIIAGLGGRSTWEACAFAKAAQEAGADAMLTLPPYYYGFNEAEIFSYYEDISKASSLPIMIYDNPGKTGVNLSVRFIAELFRRINSVQYIKDSSADARKIFELRQATEGQLTIFAGWDSLMLEGLLAGAEGIVSGGSNFVAGKSVQLFNLVQEKKYAEALEHYSSFQPLICEVEDYGRLATWLKYAVKQVHHDMGIPRRPYKPIDEQEAKTIDSLLAQTGLI